MKDMLRPFIRSVALGSLAGAAPIMILTTFLGVMLMTEEGHFVDGAGFALLPLMIAGAVVLTSAVVIGVPLSLLLRKHGRESEESYLMAGLLFGAMIPAVFMIAIGSDKEAVLPMAASGMLGGFVTARTWWRSGRMTAVANATSVASRNDGNADGS